ncbi:DUF2188 domain-containing protein [Pseudalkalibacillus caeni]|uniref:DUF2188 domain-containing protein n=1 Tax=Exobacillus caeni TaxID=2574798 RepID=A0A5R9F542_9BACL|nr:DUF2188 domain-containing protein [Pseudalkalibacillus caeni]TLS38151.1 DUF2188 domain-containing protein [Pseudalkalibacillus caeni]
MNQYTITPNKDVTGWYVEIEDVAPTNLYQTKAAAIEEGEKIAKNNKPSKLVIMDEDHNVAEERTFGE